jgi:hypothetical protein
MMIREFIYVQSFEKVWKSLGLSDKEIRSLENVILRQPDIGDLVQGTGGLRKMRFGVYYKGKSSGIRILYVDFPAYETTSFLFAYPKNELENITDQQKQAFKRVINAILGELKRKKGE